MMRILFISTLLFLLTQCQTPADTAQSKQTEQLAASKSVVKIPEEQSLTWAIHPKAATYPNAKSNIKISFLFGTIHGGVDPIKELPIDLYALLAKSDVLYLEADFKHLNAKKLRPYLFYSGSENLEIAMGESGWNLLLKALPDQSPASLRRLKPWMVMSLLINRTITETSKKGQVYHAEAIDSYLYDQAVALKKELAFLETGEAQIKIASELFTAKDITIMLQNSDEYSESFSSLVKLYKNQEIQKLYDSFLEDYDHYENAKDLHDRLLVKRNRAWIPVIEECLQTPKKTCLFAFGAGHLAGSEGVIQLLRQRGWKIEPYRTSFLPATSIK